MGFLTNVDGCAIEKDLLYIAQTYDNYEVYAEFTRLSFYDGQSAEKWLAHDVKWKTASICVWRNSPFAPRVYVALSVQGDIEIVGPSGLPHIVEHIPGSGMIRPSSLGKGSMSRVRQIGASLYACGGGFQTFKRTRDGWVDFTSTLDKVPSTDGADYLDIQGLDEFNVYALGTNDDGESRLSFWNGVQWRVLKTSMYGLITSLLISQNGTVFIGGSEGRLFYGDNIKGFSLSGITTTVGGIYSLVEFNGYIYVGSTSGLFRTRGGGKPIETVELPTAIKIRDIRSLSAADGLLWVFCGKDIIYFDGGNWSRLIDLDL